ncbi:MAG TPA: hypothetical protein VL334_12560 [Anaerolineae bacterium]|nr:hypothetical protein [Anaerolineae bacterium]
MNYTDIIKRAARLTWRYKVLWILGILLALSGGSGGGNSITYTLNGNGGGGDMVPPMFPNWNFPDPGVIAGFVLLCCCLLAVLLVVLTIVQYVARTGLYRAVDQIEGTGVAPNWREGLRLGWNNRAVRMFLLDLIVGIAVFIVVIALLLLAASPLLLFIFDNEALSIIGGIATAGLMFLAILIIAAAVVVVSVLQQFWRRQIALDDRSVGEALSLGTQMARRKAGDVAILWLLMAVIGVLFAIVLIPVVIGLGLLGGGIGAALGYAVYSLTNSVGWAVLLGLPVFMLIMVVPLIFVQGVYLVFESSTWTLAYRDLAAVPEQTV